MNVLLNGSAVQEPSVLSAEWVTSAGVLLRQVTLQYDSITPAAAALVLAPGTNPAGVNVTFLDPVTNANATLLLVCYTASVSAVLERAGSILYAPLILSLRAVPPGP